MLENNCGGGCSIINERDIFNVVSIDEVFDDNTRIKNSFSERVREEVVGLSKEAELPGVLSGEDGAGTASEAAVVDSGDGGLVVGEFVADLVFCYGVSEL